MVRVFSSPWRCSLQAGKACWCRQRHRTEFSRHGGHTGNHLARWAPFSGTPADTVSVGASGPFKVNYSTLNHRERYPFRLHSAAPTSAFDLKPRGSRHVTKVLPTAAEAGPCIQTAPLCDPAVGSGSLLLKFAKVLGKDNVTDGFYGQEIYLTTYNLARINMFLHDTNYVKFNLAHGDTLIEPAHWNDEPFEAIVSNPPYLIKWDGDANPLLINDERFSPAGVLAPKSKADLAFTMHILHWLAVDGTAAIVEFPGVLYRGGAERKIRKYLVDNNYIDAVIQLPPDLFFGTTIATCIIVLKKSKKDNSILFIDASGEFTRNGYKNKLTAENQDKILEAFTGREDIEYFAKLIPNEEIAGNDFIIAVSSYVEPEDTREVIDISELDQEISRIVRHQEELRTKIDAIVADLEGQNV